MAFLQEHASRRQHFLASHSLVGRALHCQLRLDDTSVSGEHAAFNWTNGHWILRDLGSTNGTRVNGQLLSPGQDVALKLGDRVVFAEVEWILSNVDEPAPVVASVGGSLHCQLNDGVITIPHESRPQGTIFLGADGLWILEAGDEVRPLQSGSVFVIESQQWTFWAPTQWESTSPTKRTRLVRDSTLIFNVSLDEERVVLTVESKAESIPMGQSSGYYFLLTLARLRQRLQQPSDEQENGWVHREDLTRMLRCGEQQLNVWIHRVRSKFSTNGFLDYANVVERMDGTGLMRLGASRAIIRTH